MSTLCVNDGCLGARPSVRELIAKMQTALAPTNVFVPARPHVAQRRPHKASRLACGAQGGLNTPSSLIGCHSQVWVGGWEKDDIVKSVKGTKDAGFDLIEGIAAINQSDQPCLFPCSGPLLQQTCVINQIFVFRTNIPDLPVSSTCWTVS